MNANEFTREQVIYLTFLAACGNMAYNFTWCVSITGRSSWVAVLLGTLLMIPVSFLILHVCKNFPECTLLDIIEAGFGKFISYIFVILYSFIVIIIAVCALIMFTGELKTYFLQITPNWVIMLVIIFVSSIFAFQKTNIMGRMIEIMSLWAILNYFPVFFLSFFKQFNWEYVIPIFDTSLWDFIKGTLYSFGSASEFLIFELVMVGFIKKPLKHSKWVTHGIFLWAFIISLADFLMVGIKNTEILEGLAQVGVESARAIQIGDFVRGMEVFIITTYQVIAISKIAICIFSIKNVTKKIAATRYNKIFTIIIAAVIYIISMRIRVSNTAYYLSIFSAIYLIIPFTFLVIMFAFLAVLIKKKRVEKNAC